MPHTNGEPEERAKATGTKLRPPAGYSVVLINIK
jgi:hypothetical protein